MPSTPAAPFCTLANLQKNVSLGGGVEHVGFMKEYFIQWHTSLTYSNSYDIFHLIYFKHNA